MTERRHHVSNSEIQCFKQCRRKWWLAYYRRLRPAHEKVSGPLVLGTNVHEALAGHYSLEPQDPIAIIKSIYADARAKAVEENDYDALATINKDADLALAMIEGYVEWVHESGIDDDIEVIAVEEEIAVDLENLPVTLIGKLDTRVVIRSSGQRLSIDHKTCASIDQLVRELQLLEQPVMYQLLERLQLKSEDVHVIGGMFNMLRKVKRTARATPPFYHREQIYHSDVELRKFYLRLHGVLTQMLQLEHALDAGSSPDEVAYPTPHADCSWKCEFRAVCPMFDDGSHVEGVIESAFKVHNPYQRYEMETS